MDNKYYDYSQEKYIEGDPTTALYTQVLGFQMLKQKLLRSAQKREEENARRAAEDKTKNYKIVEYNGIQYIKKFVKDSLAQAETWADRLQVYNNLFIDYLERKSYRLRMWHKPEHFALNLKDYKEIVKYELSLKGVK